MTKVLVVSHEASLTGAPRMAVLILRAFEGVIDERIVVIRWPGPLSGELTASADRSRKEPFRRLRVLLRRFRRTQRWAVLVEGIAASMVIRRERPDLVYLNTVKSANYARPALKAGVRVILHAHEMGELLTDTLARYRLDDLYPRMTLAACSRPAAGELSRVSRTGDVQVIPSVVDVEEIRRMARLPADVPPTATGLAVACGTADHRKGPDLWLQVVRLVRQETGERCPLFVWVGAGGDDYLARSAELGVADVVRFTGETTNPYPLIAAAELLLVPSRSDPFPLVVMEAMALSTPVVAFAVGGIADQIGDTGVLVAPEDTAAMAGAVVALLRDPSRRAHLASLAVDRQEALYGIDRFTRSVAELARVRPVESSGEDGMPPGIP